MPEVYLDMLLMERFGWTPRQLHDMDGEYVNKILVAWDVESKVSKSKHTKPLPKKPRGRGRR